MKNLTSKRHPLTGNDYADPIYVTKSGRKCYPIGGAAEETDEEREDREEREEREAEAKAEAEKEGPLMYEGRPMRQSDIDKIVTKERNRAERKEARTVAAKWGFETLEEAEAYITKQREEERAKMSEVDRKASEAEEERTAAKAEREASAKERRTASLERALIRRGVNDDDLDDAVDLLARKVPDATDAEALGEEADKFKERRKEMFTTAAEEESGGQQQRTTAAGIPIGRPGEKATGASKRFGEAGLKELERRGHIKSEK